jgi:Kef-type K+ transport system membrane component KefB
VSRDDDDGLGGKFWLGFVGVSIAFFFGAILVFIFIGNAWARWGFLGMFLVLSAVALAIGWFMDRKRAKRYESLGDAG